MLKSDIHKHLMDRLFQQAYRRMGRPLKTWEISKFTNTNSGRIRRIIGKAEQDLDKLIDKFLKDIDV